MSSSIVRLVALDHDRMLRLVRRACSPGPSQQRWRDELVRLLRVHATAEAEALVATVVAQGGPAAVAGSHQLRDIDAALEAATDALAAAEVGTADVEPACHQVRKLLQMHADILTEQVLRPVEQSVPRKEIRRLGGVYETRREHALREAGADQPTPRRLDLPRAELYELARRAGIEGRSAMSRRDLISELQRRQQS